MSYMTHFDQTTITSAVNETHLMLEKDFLDTSLSMNVPVKGSTFVAFVTRNAELHVSGFVDAAAAHMYQTGSDYFAFRVVGAKMLFDKTISFEHELPKFKAELHRVFWCQRAHVIAWSLWIGEE
jgi:hypothetical protein